MHYKQVCMKRYDFFIPSICLSMYNHLKIENINHFDKEQCFGQGRGFRGGSYMTKFNSLDLISSYTLYLEPALVPYFTNDQFQVLLLGTKDV